MEFNSIDGPRMDVVMPPASPSIPGMHRDETCQCEN